MHLYYNVNKNYTFSPYIYVSVQLCVYYTEHIERISLILVEVIITYKSSFKT